MDQSPQLSIAHEGHAIVPIVCGILKVIQNFVALNFGGGSSNHYK